ncbi:hypothetical protein [Tateyamaria omphalii]|uniref:Molybdopterin-guanine dinucleotide biosynthesis protein A n=1 Tax=Tateyamaria omphalii TaxID=299262 RepID=A0A1P8MVK9_9RHOB|nr:hypothetical protein [Tateyamaria omphalii]APX12094.1 hypothetical protein BWR18_10690 [Tateyamaria omphalii]
MTRLLALIAALVFVTTAAHAQERYEGYYYPNVTSTEEFTRVIREAPQSSKGVRVEFVTNLTVAQLAAPESPRFVFFAKGEDAKHLNVIALDDEVFSTLFRARAVLAQMTSNMRNNDFFRAQELQFVATFFDLLQLMEFDTLVVSDGETWAHQVNFVR